MRSCGRYLGWAMLSTTAIAPHHSEEKRESFDFSAAWRRVKDLYQTNKYGEISIQLNTLINTLGLSFLGAFAVKGLPASQNALNKFIEENQNAIFHNKVDVKQRLQKAVVLSLIKGGFLPAWRFSLFTTGVLASIFTVNAFLGKLTILEFIMGGAALGAARKYKYNNNRLMIKGAAKSACICGVLGVGIIHVMEQSGTSFTSIFTDIRLDQDQIKSDKPK